MDKAVQMDLNAMLLGAKLGSGCYRTVYEYGINPEEWVVKIEQPRTFANVREWDVWCDVRARDALAEWLAPCHSISPCGRVLLQRRTKPVSLGEMPKSIPAWMTDLKLANWGTLDGRVVCHDYANHLIQPNNRMKKADWWGE